uniref:Uncharacterized protein n=1 Tax=Glossina pallidipes TaxID=7398 RepID=A0A1B0AK45_GLOPL
MCGRGPLKRTTTVRGIGEGTLSRHIDEEFGMGESSSSVGPTVFSSSFNEASQILSAEVDAKRKGWPEAVVTLTVGTGASLPVGLKALIELGGGGVESSSLPNSSALDENYSKLQSYNEIAEREASMRKPRLLYLGKNVQIEIENYAKQQIQSTLLE